MPLSISADAMSSPRRCGGTDDTWYPARRRSMPEPTAGHRGDTRAWHPASQGRFGHAAERHGVRALMAADGRDPVLCSLWSVERSELEQPSVWRRMLPYAAASLLLFVGTMGSNGMIAWYVCAFAVGLGVWQLWMRRARLWWTWAMLAAVLLYWLSWRQPYLVFPLIAWILVIVTLVAEAGRAIGAVRGRRAA